MAAPSTWLPQKSYRKSWLSDSQHSQGRRCHSKLAAPNQFILELGFKCCKRQHTSSSCQGIKSNRSYYQTRGHILVFSVGLAVASKQYQLGVSWLPTSSKKKAIKASSPQYVAFLSLDDYIGNCFSSYHGEREINPMYFQAMLVSYLINNDHADQLETIEKYMLAVLAWSWFPAFTNIQTLGRGE